MSDALPQFDAQSRTLKTRFELDNPGNVLQPDMFVDVELDVDMPPAITVPADAVFDSGLRKTVFVDRGNGNFEARRVETGWRLGDRVADRQGPDGRRARRGGGQLPARFREPHESGVRRRLQPGDRPGVRHGGGPRRRRGRGRTATHDGHTYYFCSDECKKKFEADPGKYLDGKAAPGDTPAMPAMARRGLRLTAVKDLVCGMDVDRDGVAGEASTGQDLLLLLGRLQEKFDAEPGNTSSGQHGR